MSDREDGRLWYSHGPEDYTTLHFTDDEAEKAAQDEMQYYRDCAEGDLWHEDIDVLSWGEMIPHGKAQCVKRSPAPEGAPYDEEEDWQLVRLPVADSEAKTPDRLCSVSTGTPAEVVEERASAYRAYRAQLNFILENDGLFAEALVDALREALEEMIRAAFRAGCAHVADMHGPMASMTAPDEDAYIAALAGRAEEEP